MRYVELRHLGLRPLVFPDREALGYRCPALQSCFRTELLYCCNGAVGVIPVGHRLR